MGFYFKNSLLRDSFLTDKLGQVAGASNQDVLELNNKNDI